MKGMSETAAKNFGMRSTGGSYIGPKVQIKGEIKGSETCLIAGKVQGSVEVASEQVVVAPGGQVQADINASIVSIQGSVRGDVIGSRRVELRKTGVLEGNLTSARIFIEEGAMFRGCVEMTAEAKADPAGKPESRPAESGPAAQTLKS